MALGRREEEVASQERRLLHYMPEGGAWQGQQRTLHCLHPEVQQNQKGGEQYVRYALPQIV